MKQKPQKIWAKDEEARLIKMVADGKSVTDIAVILDRTSASVFRKIHRLRKDGTIPVAYDKSRKPRVFAMHNEGVPIATIARVLGYKNADTVRALLRGESTSIRAYPSSLEGADYAHFNWRKAREGARRALESL